MRVLLRKGKCHGIDSTLQIPEVDSYWYLSIRIDQSLKMKDNAERLKIAEKEMRKKLGILKPSLMNTKSRLIVFKTILKSRFWYAAAILCYYIPKNIGKLEAIIYRLLKQLFWIRANISKKALFKILNIEDINSFINKTIDKLNWMVTVEKNNTKPPLVEYLSIQAIKLRLNCLFICKNKAPLCNCSNSINNDHAIYHWPKTAEWRTKWNKITTEIKINWNIYNILVDDHKFHKDYDSISTTINKAVEELVPTYIGK